MRKIYLKVLAVSSLFLISTYSCIGDLDVDNKVEPTLENLLQQDPNAVDGLLSRLYASYALSSVSGPGDSDLGSTDNAGESPFIRGLVNLQDFTADDLKNRWGDNGLDQLTTTSNWTSNNKFFGYVFNRIYYTIPQGLT